jgi:hypothetical protein
MVARRREIGITGPALRAMMGKAKMTLLAGAMWVTAWKTSSERPRELERSWVVVVSGVAGFILIAADGNWRGWLRQK